MKTSPGPSWAIRAGVDEGLVVDELISGGRLRLAVEDERLAEGIGVEDVDALEAGGAGEKRTRFRTRLW